MKASKTVLVRVLFVVFVTAVSYPVSAQLKADFTASPQTGCAPLVVTFTDKSTGNPGSWHWDLGNGVISTEPNPISSYFDPGTYTVKLIVYNGSNSDSIVKTSYITVYQNPVAAFSLNDSIGCFPLNVIYTNNSTAGSGAITTNTWDFGDGNSASSVSPSHSYTTAGTFSVTLTVKNTYGCTNTLAKKNVINVTQGVHAAFNVGATNICHSPASVSFSQAATGTGALTYQWNFGDGGTSTSATPTHNYTTSGTYTVAFKVTSPAGCSDSVTQSLPVTFVKSGLSISDTICSNKQVQFVNTSTPTPASAVWTFGDNTSSKTISPSKVYTQSGNYTVKVVNTFSTGCTDSTSKTIMVNVGPQASFNVLDSAGCSLPFTANFKNTSAGTASSVIWNFGDGTTSTSVDGMHQYTKYGSYTVTLTAFNSNGCDTTVTKTNAVVIAPISITSVTGLPVSKCAPVTIQPAVVTNVPVSIANYNWDFGDGTVSTSANPSHTYTTAGIYTVKVSIQTAAGCTASYSFVDSVGTKLTPSFTVSPTNVCASTQVTFNNTTAGSTTFIWWYPGDGEIIYKQPNPSHNYLDTGWFSPMLVVMQNGCYDTLIEKNAVHIKGPIAKYTATNNCINKLQVSFNNESIDDKTRLWSFGDGTTDTSANPKHSYKQPGTYQTSLFVSNNQCTYTNNLPVKVVNEQGVFNISDTQLCRGTNIALNITGLDVNNLSKIVWNMGNNMTTTSTGSTTSTSFTYNVDGKFNVYAVVSDVLGCVDTLTLPNMVSVYGPHAKVVALESGACKNGTITYVDTSTTDGIHPITAWNFNYGDKTILNYTAKTQFVHQYTDTAVYVAKLTITDSYGCSDSSTTSVHITQPYASFKLSDSLVCPGKQVAFTNTTIAVGATYKWVFGDGATAATTNTSHLYTVQGVYTPHLYVTDVNNCKDSAVSATGVSVYLPSAKFLMSDSFSTCPPLTVDFTNQSKNYVSFQWSFGDGNSSVVASPEHEYTYPGVYPAKLVVTGDGGCADSAFKNITIKGPTGTLQVDKTAACYPFTENFTAVSQNAVQYLWDFSDGNTNLTTVGTTSHAYQPGSYVPKLILIDGAGCKVPIRGTDTIRVFDIQAMGFANNSLLCDSGKVSFKDTSVTNDVITSSQWAFGDNTTGTGTTVTHNYATSGTYYATLIDVTAHGCTDTLTFTNPVKVVASPVISITSATSFCVPATISMQGNIVKPDTSLLTWSWNFGNGSLSAVQNPTGISYTASGNYTVVATATNSSGCKGVSNTAITVHALPVVTAGKDTSICRNVAISLQAAGALTYVWANTPGISCTTCSSTMVAPDSTSIYSVTGTDQYGCAASDSVSVSVTQPVKVSVSNTDTLCNGDSKQLTATGAQTYKWTPAIYLSDATTAQPTFYASKDTSITYTVIGFANNNCFADTASVKVKVYPIPEMRVAQSAITADAGTSVQLSTINSADVTKWKWSPAMYLTNPNIPNPVAQPRESITYTVVAANDGACVTRAQIAVTVTCGGANVFMPNTFSPNGDGMNDKFYARGTGLYNIKSFRIFNRWGQLVYEKLNGGANNAADGWDGTINGQPAPSDVYVYMIEVLCINDTVVPVKGNVTLIR